MLFYPPFRPRCGHLPPQGDGREGVLRIPPNLALPFYGGGVGRGVFFRYNILQNYLIYSLIFAS